MELSVESTCIYLRYFPGSPVLKTPCFNAGCMGSIPSQGTKIPHAMQCGHKLEKKKKNIYIYIYTENLFGRLETQMGTNRAPLPSGNVCSSERVNDGPSSW